MEHNPTHGTYTPQLVTIIFQNLLLYSAFNFSIGQISASGAPKASTSQSSSEPSDLSSSPISSATSSSTSSISSLTRCPSSRRAGSPSIDYQNRASCSWRQLSSTASSTLALKVWQVSSSGCLPPSRSCVTQSLKSISQKCSDSFSFTCVLNPSTACRNRSSSSCCFYARPSKNFLYFLMLGCPSAVNSWLMYSAKHFPSKMMSLFFLRAYQGPRHTLRNSRQSAYRVKLNSSLEASTNLTQSLRWAAKLSGSQSIPVRHSSFCSIRCPTKLHTQVSRKKGFLRLWRMLEVLLLSRHIRQLSNDSLSPPSCISCSYSRQKPTSSARYCRTLALLASRSWKYCQKLRQYSRTVNMPCSLGLLLYFSVRNYMNCPLQYNGSFSYCPLVCRAWMQSPMLKTPPSWVSFSHHWAKQPASFSMKYSRWVELTPEAALNWACRACHSGDSLTSCLQARPTFFSRGDTMARQKSSEKRQMFCCGLPFCSWRRQKYSRMACSLPPNTSPISSLLYITDYTQPSWFLSPVPLRHSDRLRATMVSNRTSWQQFFQRTLSSRGTGRSRLPLTTVGLGWVRCFLCWMETEGWLFSSCTTTYSDTYCTNSPIIFQIFKQQEASPLHLLSQPRTRSPAGTPCGRGSPPGTPPRSAP